MSSRPWSSWPVHPLPLSLPSLRRSLCCRTSALLIMTHRATTRHRRSAPPVALAQEQ